MRFAMASAPAAVRCTPSLIVICRGSAADAACQSSRVRLAYRASSSRSTALAPAYRPFTSRSVTQYTWRTAFTSGMAMTASARCRNAGASDPSL